MILRFLILMGKGGYLSKNFYNRIMNDYSELESMVSNNVDL